MSALQNKAIQPRFRERWLFLGKGLWVSMLHGALLSLLSARL